MIQVLFLCSASVFIFILFWILQVQTPNNKIKQFLVITVEKLCIAIRTTGVLSALASPMVILACLSFTLFVVKCSRLLFDA
jgi:hypothetical protein